MKHVTLLFTLATLCASSLAFADAGADADVDAGADADVDGGADADTTDGAAAEAGPAPVPLACDGALCDTSNTSTCDVAPSRPDLSGSACAVLIGLTALVAGATRRARKESSR